jgi:hypothetical protein
MLVIVRGRVKQDYTNSKSSVAPAPSRSRTRDQAAYETSCLPYHAWAPDGSGQLYALSATQFHSTRR